MKGMLHRRSFGENFCITMLNGSLWGAVLSVGGFCGWIGAQKGLATLKGCNNMQLMPPPAARASECLDALSLEKDPIAFVVLPQAYKTLNNIEGELNEILKCYEYGRVFKRKSSSVSLSEQERKTIALLQNDTISVIEKIESLTTDPKTLEECSEVKKWLFDHENINKPHLVFSLHTYIMFLRFALKDYIRPENPEWKP